MYTTLYSSIHPSDRPSCCGYFQLRSPTNHATRAAPMQCTMRCIHAMHTCDAYMRCIHAMHKRLTHITAIIVHYIIYMHAYAGISQKAGRHQKTSQGRAPIASCICTWLFSFCLAVYFTVGSRWYKWREYKYYLHNTNKIHIIRSMMATIILIRGIISPLCFWCHCYCYYWVVPVDLLSQVSSLICCYNCCWKI